MTGDATAAAELQEQNGPSHPIFLPPEDSGDDGVGEVGGVGNKRANKPINEEVNGKSRPDGVRGLFPVISLN